MGTLLTMLLPAIAPAFTDAIRGIIAKVTGNSGAQPVNVDERVKLMQAETEKLKALAALDTPAGSPSQIIVDIRAIYRYAAITLIWIVAAIAIFTHQADSITLVLMDMCGASLSFIIGERFYLKITGK